MILVFIVILSAGQFYSVLSVQVLNILIFMELNNIKRNEEKEIKIPMTKYINWYLFASFNYYSLGKFISYKLPYLGIQYPFIG
jgi:CDP-diglyceride synthetase